MAITRAHKARIMIDDKWHDFEVKDLEQDFIKLNFVNNDPVLIPNGLCHSGEISFTMQMSDDDVQKLRHFFIYLFCPNLRYYQWVHRRSILNPNCMRYRDYLRRLNG